MPTPNYNNTSKRRALAPSDFEQATVKSKATKIARNLLPFNFATIGPEEFVLKEGRLEKVFTDLLNLDAYDEHYKVAYLLYLISTKEQVEAFSKSVKNFINEKLAKNHSVERVYTFKISLFSQICGRAITKQSNALGTDKTIIIQKFIENIKTENFPQHSIFEAMS